MFYMEIFQGKYVYSQSKRQKVCPLDYHQSASELRVTHSLGHMIYGYTVLVPRK